MIYKNVNGTQKLVTNIRKPKKWRRFEYLQSSGTQWIDTGVYGHMNHTYEIVFQQVDAVNYRTWGVFGQSSYIGYNMSFTYGSSTSWMLRWENTSNSQRYISVATIDTNRHTLKIQNGEVYFDGISKGTPAGHNSGFSINYNLYLFTINPANTTPSTNTKCKIYEYKDIDENNNLIRHLIPCQYNGQYGMWDLVEDKFYGNKGTGAFTVGPEIANYDEIEKLIVPSTLLPSGIELYDYIESNGTQYIHIPNSSPIVKTEISFALTQRNTNQDTILSLNGNQCYWQQSTGAQKVWNSNGSAGTVVYTVNTRISAVYEITSTSTTIQINGGTVQSITKYFDTSGIYICAWKTPNYFASAKLYSCQISENTIITHNLLPCTYFGEPGMWDTVTKQFYKNQGTGQFTLGNKIELVQYDYLQGTGTQWINTEWQLTQNFKFNYKVNMQSNGSNPMIWGSYVAGNRYTCQWPYNNTIWNQRRNSGLTQVSAILNQDCVVEDTLNTSTINGVLNSSNSMTFSNNGVPLGIFNSPGTSYIAKGKLYYFQIRDGNNLVKDFIPCTCNGTPGLWDKVELKFYGNAGSGTFALGRQVSGEIPVWVQKNALIKSSSNGVYDYIDTGINNYTMNNIRCVCEMTPLNGEDTAFFGSRGSYYLFYKVSDNYFWPTSKCETIQGRLAVGCKYLVDWNKGTLTVTGEDGVYQKGVRSSTTNNTQNLYIFTFNPKDARTAEAKIHWFKIYIDDVLVRDFVPATMGGRPGLYDKVNHKMYFNANSSGNFTVE